MTNFQRNETCEKTRRDMSVSMGHTLAVQQRNYNYERTTDACARVLNDTVEHSAMLSSDFSDLDPVHFSDLSLQSPVQPNIDEIGTPQTLNSSCDSIHLTLLTSKCTRTRKKNLTTNEYPDGPSSSFTSMPAGPSSSSTPMKSLKRIAPDSELDKTLQNLRNKKIKTTMTIQQLRDELISAVSKMNDSSRTSLFTKKGNMSIKPLKKLIPTSVFDNFSIQEIKKQLGIIELHRILTE